MHHSAAPAVAAAAIASAGLVSSTRQPESWPMHSMDRPLPRAVTPGEPSRGELVGSAPSDAVVLLGGPVNGRPGLDAWRSASGGPVAWSLLPDGTMRVVPGSGDAVTAQAFGDCQLHLEWMCPDDQGHRTGQNRGNSGVFLMGRYEVQILSDHDNRTYADGMAAAVYGQSPPMVTTTRPMGQWQVYDIIFRRPRFADDGSLLRPAIVTVLHNGVLVQDHFQLVGPGSHLVQRPYERHADAEPLRLQDHREPVAFRNIWIRSLE